MKEICVDKTNRSGSLGGNIIKFLKIQRNVCNSLKSVLKMKYKAKNMKITLHN